jgi:hypothetical protein
MHDWRVEDLLASQIYQGIEVHVDEENAPSTEALRR